MCELVALRKVWLQATEHQLRYRELSQAKETSKPAPKVTQFLQQGYTQYHKATSPHIATPYEIMEANYIQTITFHSLAPISL